MKYSKRYIAFTIVLALVFILKFQILGVDNAQVGRFRGGELDTQVWNPMVAKEVNGQTIHAVIDNQTYNNSKSKFYMDKNRNIMVPVSMLRDALNCSAHVYDKNVFWWKTQSVRIDGCGSEKGVFKWGCSRYFIRFKGSQRPAGCQSGRSVQPVRLQLQFRYRK